MRRAAWLVVAFAAVGCKYAELPRLTGDAQGDDSGGAVDGDVDGPPATADASLDAFRMCYAPTDLGALTLGIAASPVESNWFSIPTSGPNAGKTIFTVAAQLNAQAPITVIAIDVAKPAGGFVLNTAYAFTSTPNIAFVAQSYVLADYNQSSGTHQQALFSASGSITFTAIGEGPGANINGTVTTTNYREFDESTGSIVPGGCMSTMQSLQFYMRQMP